MHIERCSRQTSRGRRRVVLLVDHKRRDLPAAALIALHLERRGIEAHLEPLEAWRAVVPAYRPDVVVFNHLTASHLANQSAALHAAGIRVAVLPNESLAYHPDVLDFLCRRRNPNAHIDAFFCWGEPVREALVRNGIEKEARLEVVGNPKFDFYFAPWTDVYGGRHAASGRPRVLVCSNFVFARYHDLPRHEADKLFALWSAQIPLYRDYWGAIEASYHGRQRLLQYVKRLLQADRYQVVLRPHPGEDAGHYAAWIATLPPALQEHLECPVDAPIPSLILGCDLEISCETCTTALESWLADKPTIELVFERHPMLYHPEVARLNVPCDRPEALGPLVERELARAGQPEFAAARQAHLSRWCAAPDGTTCQRVATVLAELAETAERPRRFRSGWSDRRRGARLRLLRRFDLPYGFDPLLPLKTRLAPPHYREKARRYAKAIRPSEVRRAMQDLARHVDPLSGTRGEGATSGGGDRLGWERAG